MSRPIRTTLVFALISGFLVVPSAMVLNFYMNWHTALKITLWADLAVYAVLMTRWSGARLISVLFPLAILLGTALWPGTYGGFFILGLGVFSWIRSGICFQNTPVRSVLSEIITMVGGTVLLLIIGSGSYTAWTLNICLFFLIQSLYFFLVPVRPVEHAAGMHRDSFEDSVSEIEKLMEEV